MRPLIILTAMLLQCVYMYAQTSKILPENIQFEVTNETAMNSKDSEFGVNEWMGNFCFTTNRNHFDQKNKFLDEASYCVVAYDENRNYRKIYPFEALSSKTNVGSISQVINGRFYFTAENNKLEYNLKEATMSKSMVIYEAENNDGKWKISPLKIIKDKQYSYVHPTVSSNGKTMYFASDIPGGYGGMDLYVTHLTDNGWSDPKNLGPKINSDKNELFPFIHLSGKLIFTSNGHAGFGGMDLYITQIENGDWVKPENMGSPINTPANDFSIYLNRDFTAGYFSSNREGGLGNDDIYNLSIENGLSFNSKNESITANVENSIIK